MKVEKKTKYLYLYDKDMIKVERSWVCELKPFLCKCLFYPLYRTSLFAGDFYWV